LPAPTNDPLAVLQEALSRQPFRLTLSSAIQAKPVVPYVCAQVETEVQKKYLPPDLRSLQYFGHGIGRSDAEALQNSQQALILTFGHSKTNVWEALRVANTVAEEVAHKTSGLLWDDETREVFSCDEWHKKRLASWEDGVPNMAKHTTIHAYKSGEFVRAITLGMKKCGLPDVVVEDSSWSMNRTMGHLINLFCQAMAEGGAITTPGEFDLDLHRIQNRSVREPQLETLKTNGTGIARLTLKKGKWEEGDPQNRLVEIQFDRYAGKDIHARQEALLTSLFGAEDSVTPVRHTEALLAASRKARTHLPRLREAFSAGLQPGEFIQVKAPFRTPDGGQEWMWVEITLWKGGHIQGLLKNEPFNIPSLHGGQIVEVKEGDIFDYIRRFPDGTEEGNDTGRIIEKMKQTEERVQPDG
jgi:uncharacterized protein YegJ (DUF2314 family)